MMHSECSRQRVREDPPAMNQPQWEAWPSASPELSDCLTQDNDGTLPSSAEECVKQIPLPKQLEAVRKAAEFPTERHRWNTNEEVAAILIAFDRHESWEKQEVKTRPPSGTMLLYSRKKVRYRKDGYCWKKRKDGKTTREDHMKLKVQGIECIYGSYVHSAILPTFHRRCYWLLQNPDLVLVHYLNVPLTDDNKICLPPILQIDSKEWSEEELVSQLRPMFASVKHFDMPDSINEKTEGSVDSLVKHILSTPNNSSASTPVCITDARKSHAVVEALQQNSATEAKVAQTSNPGTIHGRVLQLIYSPQVVPADGAATAVPRVVNQQQGTRGTALGLTVCEPQGSTTGAVLQGLKTNAALGSGHKLVPHNGPLILNVAPMPGSKGLLILSSQQAAGSKCNALSVLHPAVSAARVDLSSSNKKAGTNRTSSYISVPKEAFWPPYSSGVALESTRAQSEPAIVAGKSPCYDISDFLNHDDILDAFSLQSAVKAETAKSGACQTSGDVPEFSEVTCAPEFSTSACVSEPGSAAETDAQDLNHIGLESMEFLFGDSGLTDQEQRSLISESDIKCEFYDFHESSLGGRSGGDMAAAVETAASTGTPCLPDNMDTTLSGNQKDMDDIKVLHGHDLMMDEFGDILDIVSESLGSSVDLSGTFSLSDGPGPVSSKLYHSGDVSVSGLSMSASDKSRLDCLQSEARSMNDDRLYCGEHGKPGLVEITDYCPEWSYTEGGTKVLVTGPWHQTASSYSILFDNLSVPTSMVQGGVLRCFAPAHCPAVVCLRVAYNGQVISEPKVFEYKSRDQTEAGSEIDWFLVQDRQVKDSLVQRFLDVKKSLPEDKTTAPLTSLQSEVTESDLVALVDRLAEQPPYPHCVAPKQSSAQLTLLHLSAALGFSRLVSALIKWRMNSPSLVSEHEVCSTSVDIKGNTPLMWACARGHLNVIAILAHWNPDSVHVANKANWRPAALLNHFGHHEIVELFQEIDSTSEMTALEELSVDQQQQQWQQQLSSSQDFESCGEIVEFCEPSSCELIFSPLCPGSLPPVSEAKTKFRTFRKPSKDGRGDSPLPSAQSASRAGENGTDMCSSVLTKCSSTRRRLRLMKRTSVDILPDFPQFHNELTKLSRTGTHSGREDGGGGDAAEARCHMVATTTEHVSCTIRLRTSSSDPHLANLVQLSHPSAGGGDPMISRIDRDLNSPVLFLEASSCFSEDKGLSLEDLQRETVAMEMDSRDDLDGLSHEDGSEMLQSGSVEADDNLTHSIQMMNLASQIIAAMPDRIKLSPNHSKHLLMDEINSRRDRTSSYGSFSSCSSSTPPICIAEDSGISTPLEGMSFLECRYSDIGTPTSMLSPSLTCIQSPYRFGLDSPPPTAAEFTEYFNAPAMYMEKDFSQLTLSDEEQQRLYEAAKIIQSFYRKYKDKKEQQLRQQQKEIEAAILIQSYYRRYKQFMYYKRMTQAAVLIQSQFRSYYAQKRFRRSREAATIIQNRYRAYKEHERYKKSRNAAVIIQQRFRSHYQRTLAGRQSTLASTVQKMMADSDVSLDPTGVQEWDIEDTEQSPSSSESGEPRPKTKSEDVDDEIVATVDDDASVSEDICCKEELSETEDNESARV